MGLDINRFVNSGDINEDLICNICKGVLEDGVWAPTCEHAFCRVCINQWLSRRSLCPNDRQPLNVSTLKQIPRFMRNLLEKLEIKCDFGSNGCQQVFPLESLRPHVTVCDFNPEKRIECVSGCGLIIKKADLQNHNCVKCLRKVMTDENQRHERCLSIFRAELNLLRTENKRIKDSVINLQNEVKRLSTEKQMTVISTANSQINNDLISSDSSLAHKIRERFTPVGRVPNPYVLITPLQTSISSTLVSNDEPSSSTLIATNRRLYNEEPAYKRRTTNIQMNTPVPSRQMSSVVRLSDFSYQISPERSAYSPHSSRFISSDTTLSISNDSNSGDESNAVTNNISNNYINLEDPEYEDNDETEAEEDISVGIIDDYEIEVQTND